MIVRVTSVDKTNLPESTELALVSVTASIENVVKMHPDYAVRSTLRLIIGCNSQEELDALDIRPGGRYLAFGADYIDRDWNCVQRWQERTDALWKILICLKYPMI